MLIQYVLFTMNVQFDLVELLSIRNGICYDHSRSDVWRSRSQDYVFMNTFFLEKLVENMRLVRPAGGAHAQVFWRQPGGLQCLGMSNTSTKAMYDDFRNYPIAAFPCKRCSTALQ